MNDEMHHIGPPAGAKTNKRIVGRGASGRRGVTAGKGNKGQNARAGGGVRPGFEGGQMPLYRRVATRGFSNHPFKQQYAIVNVGSIAKAFEDGAEVDSAALREKRLVRGKEQKVKVLGVGEVDKKITLKVDAISGSAREKVEKAGGTVAVSAKQEKVKPDGE